MTLAVNQQRIQHTVTSYTGRITQYFEFPYPYYNDTDIVVSLLYTTGIIKNNQFRTLTPTNGDTLQGASVGIPGVVLPVNTIITIERVVPLSQEYDLQEGATIDPTAINTSFDRIVAQNQQQDEDFQRSLIHPVTDPDGLNYTAPSSVTRAGKTCGWDANGNIVALDGGVDVVYGDTTKGITISNNFVSAQIDTTRGIQFNTNGKIGISDGGVTADMLDPNFISNGQLNLDFLQNIATGKVLGNTSGSTSNVTTVDINPDIINNNYTQDTSIASSKAIQQLVNILKPNIVQTVDKTYRKVESTKSPYNPTYSSFSGDDSWETLSGFECSLTPRFSTSEILLNINLVASPDNRNSNLYFRVKRVTNGETSYLPVGDDGGNGQAQCSFVAITNGYKNNATTTSFTFLDSPTLIANSIVTYSLEWKNYGMSNSQSINVKNGEYYQIMNLGTIGNNASPRPSEPIFDWTSVGASSTNPSVNDIFQATTDMLFPKITQPPLVKLVRSDGKERYCYSGWALNGSYWDRDQSSLRANNSGQMEYKSISPRATSSIVLEEIYK
ncbi:MAG: hypothetical protein Tp118DCM00d2C30442581_6 [Prokaryotic dsDNA virus sp.]|nr:MAG: hypothetical protein Tp118DCM00d2C30442581_6 [Prokaryotic dsDNA virus sp.]|tara:strand:+ start:7576 stop:9240 length:1665 start_codon:yes stop_codon:yes gene_type:complete